MRFRDCLVLLAVCAGLWAVPQTALGQCATDADCNDGVFCNGTESCDTTTGACVAVSACPPAIDGCVIRNAVCDEDNDTCLDQADDSLCEDGLFCNGIGSCDITTGGCAAVSACPPFINGCLVGGACDETTDQCLATPDNSLCPAGQVCAPDGDCVTGETIIEGLIVAVRQLQAQGSLNKGQANALVVKLNGVLAKLGRGSVGAACNQLAAFVNQVMDFVHEGILTQAQAVPLIEAANGARSALGCPNQSGTRSP